MPSKIIITFLLLSFIGIIINQTCENITNATRNDCFTLSTPKSYCCYDSDNSKCIEVSKENLESSYQYDCGISESNYGKYEFKEYHPHQEFDLDFQHCGRPNPTKKSHCTDYSELANSCCFFKKDDKTACLAIGKKSDKEGDYSYDNETIHYECYSFNLILKFGSILLMIFLL